MTVGDCFVRSFDDTIAVKGVPPLRDRPVEDIAVERCVLWCGWGKTIETGIETWAPRFRNIRYADCDILRSQASALNVSAGGPAVIEDVVFENIRVEMQADNQTAAEPGLSRPAIRVHCRIPPGENPVESWKLMFERLSMNGRTGNWNDFDISTNIPITTR